MGTCVGMLNIRSVQNQLFHIQGASKTSRVSGYQEIGFESSNMCSHMCGVASPEVAHMRKKPHGDEVAHTGAA